MKLVKQRNKKARGAYEKTTKSCEMYVMKMFLNYYMHFNQVLDKRTKVRPVEILSQEEIQL